MGLSLTRAIAFAIVPFAIFVGSARADETTDRLMALCKQNEPKPETCDCQVKAILESADPRVVTVMLALSAVPPSQGNENTMADILKANGLTQEEFDRLSKDAEAKAGPALEKCKAG